MGRGSRHASSSPAGHGARRVESKSRASHSRPPAPRHGAVALHLAPAPPIRLAVRIPPRFSRPSRSRRATHRAPRSELQTGCVNGVATRGGRVYVIGGWNGVAGSPGLSTNESYKVARDTWSTGLPEMPTPRAETGAADHGGRIYIVGGAQPAFGASVDDHEVFKP
ncbi:MAG: hypothetical protein ACREKI_06645 [Gemmatimonadota bacterium]